MFENEMKHGGVRVLSLLVLPVVVYLLGLLCTKHIKYYNTDLGSRVIGSAQQTRRHLRKRKQTRIAEHGITCRHEHADLGDSSSRDERRHDHNEPRH